MLENQEAYCVKCKKKKVIKDPTIKEIKNGRKMIQGRCPDCNTKIGKFLSKEALKQMEE